MERPVAALIRENELLRDVAERAIRLRRLGRQLDELETALEEVWRDNPVMTKSGTQRLMLSEAFTTAMAALDEAIAKAAAAGMDWTVEPEALGPHRP